MHVNGSIHVSEMFTDSKGPQQYIPSIRGTNFSYEKYEVKNVEVLPKKRGMRAPMQVGTYVIGPAPCVYEYISQRKKPRSLGNLSNRLSFCYGLLPKLAIATKAIFLVTLAKNETLNAHF